ncbi:MAG: C25 family cysteine peptidase [Bacteroidota bacterium]
MKKFLLLTALFTFLISAATTAQVNTNKNIMQKTKGTEVKMISSDIETTVIDVKVYKHDLLSVDPGNDNIFKVTADDAVSMLIAGAPDLPKIASSIIIPDDAEMQVEVLSSSYTDYENIEIAPSKGNLLRTVDPSTIPFEYGPAYSNDEFFPGKLTDLGEPYILRDFRGQVVNVYPFQYNPVSKVLRVYSDISIKVSRKSNNGINAFIRTKQITKIDREFKEIYKKHFLNLEKSPMYTPLDEHGNMLVICYSSYMSAMQPFVDWKNTIGIPAEMVSVTTAGSTASAIQTYVANYYNTNGLTFLLLVGDAAQCPSLSSNGGGADNMYGYITGGDYYQEIIVGRFSAESVAHVQTQVTRSINYELSPSTTSGLFEKCIGIGSDQGPGDDGEMDFEHQRGILADLMGFTYSTEYELFDGSQGGLDATGNPSAANLSPILNAGAGVITYTGHGSDNAFTTTGFSNTDVDNLTNTEMWPFIWSVACVNGNFTAGTCFAEAWLRATSGGQPTGAIATFMSTINQSWDPPMEAQDEFVDILVESYTSNIKRSFGGISVNGLFLMNDTYQDYAMTDTWTVFGDPSVMVRTENPKAMTVTHQPTINMGASQMVVNCDVEGAFIALTINHQIIGTGYATAGSATINFNMLTQIDTITVAATAFNYIPYIGTVLIVNSVQNDAAPLSIIEPQSNYNCSGITVNPAVVLENMGINNLTSVTVDCQYDGSSIGTQQWTGNLASFESDTLVFSSITLAAGPHTIEFITSLPNGTTDGNTANDIAARSINVQDLAVVSDFNADQTDFCTAPADVQFTNLSQNAQSYLWDFGDGTTSTDENPLHTYTELGAYTVILTADAGICGTSVKTDTSYIIVGATPPDVTDATLCGPGVATLSASGQGILTWYDAATGGNIVNTGSVYTTPNLSATTTYYVTDSISAGLLNCAKPDNTGGGGYTSTGDHYLIFDCMISVTLVSVKIYGSTTAPGNKTIELRNNSGTVLQSATVNVLSGLNTYTLNFDVPVGTDLQLGCEGTDLYRNNSGVIYPYTLTGYISVTNSSAGVNYYYYFYNWEIQPPACISAMTPVTAYINNNAPVADFSYNVNGLTVDFTDQSVNPALYNWDFGDGTSGTDANPSHNYTSAGTYNVTLIVTNGCGSDTTIMQVTTTLSGISSLTNDNDFVIFPNPSHDGLIYVLSNLKENGILVIYNSTGQLIDSIALIKGKMLGNRTSLDAGLYYFVLRSNDTITTRKLIVTGK